MDDGYNLTIHGLLRKRGELSSEVDALRNQLGELLSALDHVDATIRVFKPDIDIEDLPERPAPPPNAAFRGEVQRFLLHMLKAADRPLSTSQLAESIMASRRLNTADRVLAKLVLRRTGHSLGRLRRMGMIEGERFGNTAEMRWRLTSLNRIESETGIPR